MLTPSERQRVMWALGASDLIQVGDQHMLLMPVDHGILETLAVWGAEDEDVEDDDAAECNGDPEQECGDEGFEPFARRKRGVRINGN
ncbi:MAG: hypothetical protein AAGG65_17180 [Pseudomonadota bacterium]